MSTVHVLATTLEATSAALAAAVPLARGSHSRLMVVVTQVVPYTIPLERPVDSPEPAVRRYRDLVRELNREADVVAQIRVCLCRRPDDVVTRLLPAHATVVVGGETGGLLPSRTVRLVRHITRLGHHVIFVPLHGGVD